jgi:hypothetical protein
VILCHDGIQRRLSGQLTNQRAPKKEAADRGDP